MRKMTKSVLLGRLSGLVLAAVLALFLFSDVNAETKTTGNATAGQKLAEINCARCHAIGADDKSPLAEAPPFREIMKRYQAAMLEEALGEGIVTGHAGMPEFVFSTDEVADITAYLAQFEN